MIKRAGAGLLAACASVLLLAGCAPVNCAAGAGEPSAEVHVLGKQATRVYPRVCVGANCTGKPDSEGIARTPDNTVLAVQLRGDRWRIDFQSEVKGAKVQLPNRLTLSAVTFAGHKVLSTEGVTLHFTSRKTECGPLAATSPAIELRT